MSGARRTPRPRSFSGRPVLTEERFREEMARLAVEIERTPPGYDRAVEMHRLGPEVFALVELARAPLDLGAGASPPKPRPFAIVGPVRRVHYDLHARAAAVLAELNDGLPEGWDSSWPRPGNQPGEVDVPGRSYPWDGPMDAVRRTQARRKQAQDDETTDVAASGRWRVRVNRRR